MGGDSFNTAVNARGGNFSSKHVFELCMGHGANIKKQVAKS